MSEQKIGKITQVIGPVVDVEFEPGQLPAILNACYVTNPGINDDEDNLVIEVAQHLGDEKMPTVFVALVVYLVRFWPGVCENSVRFNIDINTDWVSDFMHFDMYFIRPISSRFSLVLYFMLNKQLIHSYFNN